MSRALVLLIPLSLLVLISSCAHRRHQTAATAQTVTEPAPVTSQASPKILIALSSANKLTLRDGGVHPTGYYLNELAVPLQALVAAGFEPVFADPKGNPSVMDPGSDTARDFGGDDAKRRSAKEFLAGFAGLAHPHAFHEILRDGIDGYAGVFIPGGHAPMEDLVNDSELGRILRAFHERGKPTAMICHGPLALLSSLPDAPAFTRALPRGLSTRLLKGLRDWPYRGYRVTVFSTDEERSAEDRLLGGRVRFYPDRALKIAGARVELARKYTSHIVVDRELVTGQNPNSDVELSAAFLKLLAAAGARP